jgi:hypothetical protein
MTTNYIKLLEIRNRVEGALKAKSFDVDGGGVGVGFANLFVELNGERWLIDIKPIDSK